MLFNQFFNDRQITPLFLNFLHLAYFKLNKNNLYRPRLITKLDTYATRLFKYNLSVFKQNKFSSYNYLFILMKKKTHFQKVLDLFKTNNSYNLRLHQLQYFQQVKKSDFRKFTACPKALNISTEDSPFFTPDNLSPKEHSYVRKMINFFYPVTEILFKENYIHGKPMKTKLPRRI